MDKELRFDDNSCQLRRLTTSDIDRFYTLFRKLIFEEIPEISEFASYFEQDYSRDRLYSSLGYSKIVIMGLFEEDSLIGFLWGNDSYAGLGFISWLMIKQGHRGNGLAKKLLASYEQFLRSKNAHVVELYCFESLRQFYENNGYKVIGIRPKGYFKLKQYIMEKEL